MSLDGSAPTPGAQATLTRYACRLTRSRRNVATRHCLALTGIRAALYIPLMDVHLPSPRTSDKRPLPVRVLRMGMCTAPAVWARQGQ